MTTPGEIRPHRRQVNATLSAAESREALRDPGDSIAVPQDLNGHFNAFEIVYGPVLAGRLILPGRSSGCCLQPGALLWSDDVLVAVEITSSDDDIDFNDKRAEYAAQGIPVYLIVVMSGSGVDSIGEHRLDRRNRSS